LSVWAGSTIKSNENICAGTCLKLDDHITIGCDLIVLANSNKFNSGCQCLKGINQLFVLALGTLAAIPVKLPVFCCIVTHLTNFIAVEGIAHHTSMISVSITIQASRMGKVEVVACREMR